MNRSELREALNYFRQNVIRDFATEEQKNAYQTALWAITEQLKEVDKCSRDR